jgi:aryl-alcohol dehydrogenase-like predicted oxidoreductase
MATIPRRTLGRTGLEVSVLGFGALELQGPVAGPGREITPEHAAEVLHAVLDVGINFIDTSIDYGMSEEHIGRVLPSRREEFILASKCGCPPGIDPTSGDLGAPHAYDRKTIVDGVEQSLKRLRVEYLDLVQLHHNPSRAVLEAEDTVATLHELQAAGKVRFIGASSLDPNLSDHIAMGVFDVFQIPYSALERTHEHTISAAAAAGAGVVIRGGVANGPPGMGRRNAQKWEMLEAARLDDLLDGGTVMEFLLRFVITHPDMTTTIVGTLNLDHLAANVAAVTRGPLPDDVYAEAKVRLDAVGALAG